MTKFRILFSALIVSLFLISCKKDDDNSNETTPEETNTVSPNMSWKMNAGEISFEADTTTYSYDYDNALGLHVLSAADGSGRNLTFMLASVDPGTYEVDFDSTIVIWQVGANLYNGGFNPQGEIVITENNNNKIRGTFNATVFSFTTASEVEITSGSFNLLPVAN